jgi:phospholipase/lecithinase/hemolysin
VALLALASAARAEPISRIVVFGDSLSDTGNVFGYTNGVTPAPPYFEGRFSNGPVWVERMAEKLGLSPPVASFHEGYNYAFGGAETGQGLSTQGSPNLLFQLALYQLAPHVPARSDLFVVWCGANDIFVKIGTSTPPDLPAYVANIASAITTLSDAGGSRFLVPNLPPLGQTPWLRSIGYEADGDNLSAQFNTALSAELSQLRTTLGVTIYELDTHALFAQALAEPGKFGLTNVTDPAFDAGSVVPNPQEYMFWDDEHPTATVHALLGEYAAAAVPEPSALALWLSGGITAVLLVLRRRRR